MRDLLPEQRVVSPSFARALLLSAGIGVLSACLTSAAHAQDASEAYQTEPTTVAANQSTTGAAPATGAGTDSTILTAPPFDWGGAVSASEAYTSNAGGISGANRPDYISTLGVSAYVHERSRRVVLDANYAFGADFYAEGRLPTQISNNLQAVGSVEAIPDYLTINAKAFAQPVITSPIGIVTAGNRVVPNGFHNSFGYYVEPDLKFRLGTIATSETTATYGSTYFTNPAGATPSPIPGLPGPQDSDTRSAMQTFSSGEYFDRLNWILVGDFSETRRRQGLLAEKAGVANLRYAISHEFSLLASVGYDAITNTTGLTRNVSGLVAMGGFALTLGSDFSFQVEAGRKYNDMSYLGSLRYNLSPKSSVVASVNDSVTTPEGQLLSSLTTLTSTVSGSLTSNDNLLGNGTPASLVVFNPQTLGSTSFDQNISRNQTINVSFFQDFDRNHAALSLYGTRRTILSGVFVGPPRTDRWGGQLNLSRNITPVLLGTVGAGYSVDQELGGTARSFTADAELNYSLTHEMMVFLQANYLDRQSSAALKALSPFTGSLTDYRITLGINRTF